MLNHAHNTASCSVLLVGLEAWRRRRACRLLLLQEGSRGLLLVEALEDVERCCEQLLSGTLVRDGHLELLVLLLAVLTSTLHLHLHLCNLGLQLIDGISELIDGHLEVLNLGNEVGFL